MLSTSSHMALGGSREVVYASTAPLHASPVVWVEVAVFKYWTALLNCRRNYSTLLRSCGRCKQFGN